MKKPTMDDIYKLATKNAAINYLIQVAERVGATREETLIAMVILLAEQNENLKKMFLRGDREWF